MWTRMMSAFLLAATALLLGGCVAPAYYWTHASGNAGMDWKCGVAGVESQDGSPFTMWANDKGLHDLTGVLTDPNILCVHVTPQQVCDGAPDMADCMSQFRSAGVAST